MILHRLLHHGSHAFPREIRVDFDALPSVLAVTGQNGAGKSTLLDVLMAPFLGEFAYRPGALARQFVSKGVIDLTWSQDGTRYRSVLTVDPDLERTEASLFTADGALITGPLIRDYRRHLTDLVGPPERLLASAYAVQNGVGAFLSLPRPARKALLADLLGLQRFASLEMKAKEHGRAIETTLAMARARLSDLEARITAGATIEAAHRVAGAQLITANDEATSAREHLRAAQAAHNAAQRTLDALTPLRTERDALTVTMAGLDATLTDLAARQANNTALLAETETIRAAGPEADRLQAVLNAAHAAKDVAQILIRQRADVRQRAASLEKDLRAAAQLVADLTRQIDRVTTVPCLGKGKYAACGFLADAHTARAAGPSALQRIETFQDALIPLQAELATWSDDPTTSLLDAQTAVQATEKALAILRPTLDKVGPLGAAQARLEELQRQGAAVQDDRQQAGIRWATLNARLLTETGTGRAMVEVARETLDAAERTATTAHTTVTRLAQEVGRLEGQLAGLTAAEGELAALAEQVAPLVADVADWEYLRRAFSPQGIPVLLMDASLPEISILATDLLRECFGDALFTVQLNTQRLSADEHQLIETLDVIVRRGTETIDASLLSGGERVIVSEALSLAIALFTTNHSGRSLGTLLRDEVSAPLSSEWATAYVTMLRRAQQIGGFRQILCITHQERAIQLADAQLAIADGTITIA